MRPSEDASRRTHICVRVPPEQLLESVFTAPVARDAGNPGGGLKGGKPDQTAFVAARDGSVARLRLVWDAI